jgi:hypothetical protein
MLVNLGLFRAPFQERKTLKRGGGGVRGNCNVFNLAMENVLKGLPSKIRDQLSRHHTQNKSTSNVHIFESREMK